MSCKSLLYMVGMFVFVPAWIGLLWTDFFENKRARESASARLGARLCDNARHGTACAGAVCDDAENTDAGTSAVAYHSAVSCGAVVCHLAGTPGGGRGDGRGHSCADGGRHRHAKKSAWESRNVDDCLWDSCGGSDSAAGIYPRALRAQRR